MTNTKPASKARTRWSMYETWLKPIHLAKGRGTLTITQIADEDLYNGHGKSESIPVASFKECRYKLPLSPTNCRKLTELFGDEIEACIGKRVIIVVENVKVGNATKNVLRISGIGATEKVDTKTGEVTEDAATSPH